MRASDPGAIESVVGALRQREPVVIPTDTVYGLAADPTSPEAMKRLFELKERPDGVPIAVLVGTLESAKKLIEWSPLVDSLAQAHWPGALTIVGKATASNLHIGATETLGVRLPDHDFIRACSEAFGPIAATSANRHGEPTITEPTEATEVFRDDVKLVVDGGLLDGVASTVVDATGTSPIILREGVVRLDSAD